MTGRGPIADYVRVLAVALPGSRRRRERILAEVADHLHAHADALVAAGHPEKTAVAQALERFGAPEAVAASFAESGARRVIASAGAWTALLVAAYAAGVVVLSQVPGVGRASPLGDGVAGVVGFLAAQLAVVAAAVALLRGARLRGRVRAGAEELALAVRANALAAGAAAVALAVDGAALAGHWRPGAGSVASAAALGVLGSAALWALARLWHAAAQVRRLRALEPSASPAASALEQLGELARELPAPLARPAVAALEWGASHRAACIALAGALPGAVLAAAGLREHGVPHSVSALGAELLAAAVVFAIELAAVVACAYGFDRLLGLFPRRGAPVS